MVTYSDLIWPLVFRVSLAIVIVFGCVGFAVGIGLIVSSARTFRFFHAINRWVSIRRALKSAEIPRDIDQLAHRYRYWVGIPLVLGGIFSTFGLVARINASAVGATFTQGTMVPLLAVWLTVVVVVTPPLLRLQLVKLPLPPLPPETWETAPTPPPVIAPPEFIIIGTDALRR